MDASERARLRERVTPPALYGPESVARHARTMLALLDALDAAEARVAALEVEVERLRGAVGTVYAVTWTDYDEYAVLHVCATRALAEQRLREHREAEVTVEHDGNVWWARTPGALQQGPSEAEARSALATTLEEQLGITEWSVEGAALAGEPAGDAEPQP